jgi:hypothetical protein
LEHWNFLPAPFTLAIDNVLTTLFASRHKVMRHFQSPQKSAIVTLNRLNSPTPQEFERSERTYALGEPRHSDYLEIEMARSVTPKHMTYDGETTVVCEIGVVSFAVEEVYFVTTRRRVKHSILSEMISRPVPVKAFANQAVSILLC